MFQVGRAVKETSEMDHHFIHYILDIILFLSVDTFGPPPLTLVVEIRPKTDVCCSLLSVSASSLSSISLLLIFWLCLLTAHYRLFSVIHGITTMASSMIFFTFSKTSLLVLLSRDVMTILLKKSCLALFLADLMFAQNLGSLVDFCFCLLCPMIDSKNEE